MLKNNNNNKNLPWISSYPHPQDELYQNVFNTDILFFFLKETQWNKVRNQLKEIWEIHKYVEIK